MASGKSDVSPSPKVFKVSRRRTITSGWQHESSKPQGQKTEHTPTQALPHKVSNENPPNENTSRKATIEILPADVLVKIFDSYRLDSLIHSQLGARLWKWLKLAHVCKTWRSVLLASPRYLDLRLSFTYGMPVREILSFWPVLPIVMQYVEVPGSSPLTVFDQDNIMALLALPTRLCDVQLTVTTLLLENISTLMQQSFAVLEYLQVYAMHGLVLPSEFGSGMPRLRALCMDGLALPALPQLLLSAHDLVTLRLDKLPSVGYTLEALIISLPTMTQLKTLRIRFLSPTIRPVILRTDRMLPELSVLPVLNSLEFHGTCEYLESLLFGISAPRLEKSHINLFNQLIFDTPQLRRFIYHSTMQQSTSYATIHSSSAGISIILTGLGVPHELSLRISCNQLDWQIPSMAEVCDSLSPTLSGVEQLEIKASTSLPEGQDDMDLIHSGILDLLRPFRNVKRLWVTDTSLSLVSGALELVTGELALPELQEIQTKHFELTSAQSSLAPFITARQHSTHPVVICSSTLHTMLAAPSLQYDMRYHPKQSNLRLSAAVLAEPATRPHLASLPIRVAGLSWHCTAQPDPLLSPGNAIVTVQDVLVCLYSYLRTAVTADEYNATGSTRKAEIYQAFGRRVGHNPAQRGKGLRRVDFLGGHFIAQGLVRAQSKDEVWDLVVRRVPSSVPPPRPLLPNT